MYDYRDFTFKTIDDQSGFWTNPCGSIFNPGMVLHKSTLHFAYRTGNTFWLPTNIAIGTLDNQLNPKEQFGVVNFSGLDPTQYTIEDPRLFLFQDELYLQMALINRTGQELNWARVAITKRSNLVLQLLQYQRKENRFEKNWIFFEYDGNLYCSYSKTNGFHTVCQIVGSNAELRYITEFKSPADYQGNVRGCSNLVTKDGLLWGTGFIGTYQTKPDNNRIYGSYLGFFYAIESTPPFKMKYIQREPMLTSTNSYLVRPRNMVMSSIFPSGLMLEKSENWIVAAGINDSTTAFMRIPHSLIMQTIEEC